MEIKTNNQWRNFLYGYELTDKEKADFDYLGDLEDQAFVKYKNRVYALSDFTSTTAFTNDSLFDDWQGYISDSAFSGILIKVSEDGEQYQIATYIG